MSAKGFNAAEEGKVMQILTPADLGGTSTRTSLYINMEGYEKCQIILNVGASAGTATAILYESDNGSGNSVTAIAANYYTESTTSGDTLGARTALATTGLTIAATAGTYYVIDVDSSQLTEGYPYLNLRLSALDSTTVTCATAILSGARYGYDQNATAQ
jgi:hypothetical protein